MMSMKENVNGLEERRSQLKMMSMKEKVNGSEERSSQFKKQVNGSTGEEVPLLQLVQIANKLNFK